MSDAHRPLVGLLGLGHAVPATIRTNDDPLFDWIKANQPNGNALFAGYVDRHVLGPDEAIEDCMVAAAKSALANARLAAADVDVVLGFASVSDYLSPNSLARVHAVLGLAPSCWVLPVNADFSNHSAALMLADGLVAAGRARNVLVVCGSNWTRHVSSHSPECVSAGDGAGAAVIGLTHDRTRWRVADREATFQTSGYGNMTMQGDALTVQAPPMPLPVSACYSEPYYHITPDGLAEFKTFGVDEPPAIVARLLERNAIAANTVAIIPYQASSTLLDAWDKALQPRQMLHTLAAYGNMVIANLAVNLSARSADIEGDCAVLLGLGPEPHATALLLRRDHA
ncbi:hypothetical protein [Scleromatobacter humisilvae]|uniref:Beta-ketoacyl-[acyl-carrier-protein] synthase III N-terminal domain-containing protein n=1 Tax=Scleromatobacter humisilvae TaxID=2897159 RepID=A0A9X2BXW1_9BURK|nr:hypothetical protein [Scleromatobacter humisilvae]MCK9685008.1 hypothetical protein [Scleromatobacter humisilvae]